MTGPLPDDGERIRSMVHRLGEIRQGRILIASRACSALEATTRPLRDPHLNKLVDLVQQQLSRLLADRPDADAE